MFYRLIHTLKNDKTRSILSGFYKYTNERAGFYFCQVRFLWRFAFRRFRRLCFDILRRRFFLRFPMVKVVFRSDNVRVRFCAVKHFPEGDESLSA